MMVEEGTWPSKNIHNEDHMGMCEEQRALPLSYPEQPCDERLCGLHRLTSSYLFGISLSGYRSLMIMAGGVGS